MNLVLEIEYLSGVSFAAIGPGSDVPDWPPQPDRVFSALVATWAARGERDTERQALQWLEQLPPPSILASSGEPRTGVIAFVPPNDPRSDKQKNARGVLPAFRSRQPRRFPAVRPDEPVVRLCWSAAEPAAETLFALDGLARDTAYVGHSASLTRCRFFGDNNRLGLRNGEAPRRWVYNGRLAELVESFNARRKPLPGALATPPESQQPLRDNQFSQRWLILEHVSGDMPDIRTCAVLAKTLRDALLSGYRRVGLEREIPEIVSGHSSDGRPTRQTHLAIVPLTFSGFPYADGHLMGFALVPPQDADLLKDENFRRALRALAPIKEEYERRVLMLITRPGTSSDSAFSVGLSPTFELPVGKRSLNPGLYTRAARIFATVTPIVLDRHLKKKEGPSRQEEIAAQIISACRNIGLPDPKVVIPGKHASLEGVPSAYPSGKSPAWTGWRVPGSLASRELTHAVIRFDEPVEGPVILGAGRYVGLGLCRPLDGEAQ